MRYLTLLGAVLVLSACASSVPAPDPSQAWVELRANAGTVLMADRLDGQRLNDGRYFQVPAGAHELQARFQFEVNSGGGLDGAYEPRQVTCEIRVRHDNFVAGQLYRLEARPMQMKAQAWLYDEQRNVLARGQVLRCGTF
ncbi:PA0061/PA0062 family lipoprotein [Pseudomonas anguilliseptica]|uniref:PA0061/PA0062 family lipoprotein n=1 Tax=Pseudomonas anguilliseptica TaxID=53406 RepID=UPI003735DB81